MPESSEERRRCPDGGTCHHTCEGKSCFRVKYCSPLSGVYQNDKWPAEVEIDNDEET